MAKYKLPFNETNWKHWEKVDIILVEFKSGIKIEDRFDELYHK